MTDTISFELTKVVKFKDLKPYGQFRIGWAKSKTIRTRHNYIHADEVQFNYEIAMPLTDEQEKALTKFMKKNKTDILTDSSYNGFYTIAGGGFNRVYHKKLGLYRDDEAFRALFED